MPTETIIDKLERADVPDRELDAEIHALVSPDRKHPYLAATFIPSGAAPYGCPAYTASIDAAMALVPSGCGVTTNRYWTANHDGPVWSAALSFGGIPTEPRRVVEVYDAASAALALCIAALRARSQGGE